MQSSSFHFLPPLFLALAVIFALVVAILQVGILGYAYERIGISRRAAYAILLLSLLGSYVNIPVADIQRTEVVGLQPVIHKGIEYLVPVYQQWPSTMLAINIGGAVIPTLLSIYLMVKNQIYLPAFAGTAIVAAVVHLMAEPVKHVGIAVPIFIPPILSAVVAVIMSRDYAAPIAYISGCMGTLVGADLMNLNELSNLEASVASIGGAGTFDGVFLTGLLAVILAGGRGIWRRTPASSSEAPSAQAMG